MPTNTKMTVPEYIKAKHLFSALLKSIPVANANWFPLVDLMNTVSERLQTTNTPQEASWATGWNETFGSSLQEITLALQKIADLLELHRP